MNDFNASLRRLAKFTIPACILSILFNIPKFFEASVEMVKYHDGTSRPEITVTELRKNPYYAIYYSCWARIIVTGILPIALMIYFNWKVYQDIMVSIYCIFDDVIVTH